MLLVFVREWWSCWEERQSFCEWGLLWTRCDDVSWRRAGAWLEPFMNWTVLTEEIFFFVWYSEMDSRLVVQVHAGGRQELNYLRESVSRLLMPCWCKERGHQQRCYWFTVKRDGVITELHCSKWTPFCLFNLSSSYVFISVLSSWGFSVCWRVLSNCQIQKHLCYQKYFLHAFVFFFVSMVMEMKYCHFSEISCRDVCWSFWWFSARLQYLQSISYRNTAVFQ